MKENRPCTIAEDDAIFRDDFHEASEKLISTLPADWDFVLWGWNFDSFLTVSLESYGTPSVMLFDQEAMIRAIPKFQKSDSVINMLRLDKCFGTPAYTLSPEGAKKFIMMCFPIQNRIWTLPIVRRNFNVNNLDMAMNLTYPHTNSYVSFPPLAVTPNDHAISDTQIKH